MTPAQDEAKQIALIFQAALVAYGVDSIADSLDLWEDVQATPAKSAASSGRWLAKVVNLVGLRKADARRMAFAYYRLFRALHTDRTYPPLVGDPVKSVRLNDLREDFFSTVEELTPGVLSAERELIDVDGVQVTPAPATSNPVVKVEQPEADLESAFAEMDDDEIVRAELDVKGYGVLLDKINAIDDTQPATEVDAEREQAHAEAGARQAAAAERIIADGARNVIDITSRQDPRIIGYVRVSSTGDPCGFCAMLISRGMNLRNPDKSRLYVSERTAEFAGPNAKHRADGEQYHDNCKCLAEPVYSEEQYTGDNKFDLNREMDAAWPEVTGRLRGREALSVWRKYIRQRSADRKRSGRTQKAA